VDSPFSSVGSQQFSPGWILICEGVDAPVSWVLPSRLTQNPIQKVGDNVDKLFVGIDVGSRDNAVYIMLPDGS
jgi:hypothetical protein